MCGIAGFSLSDEESVNIKRLSKALLLAIENRGGDATGFAFMDTTGAFQVHKNAVTATEFVKRRLCIPKRTRQAIFHTRFATQGHEFYNENNHPIATGTVVGVHNGHINNDDALFRSVEKVVGGNVRIGEVDSEAAFAMLGWLDAPVTEILEDIRGSAALAWLDSTDPHHGLNLARVTSSPLIVGETDKGSVVFASTKEAVVAACAISGIVLTKIRDIAEGTYLHVVEGVVRDVNTFKVPYPTYVRGRNGSYHSLWADLDTYEWATGEEGSTCQRFLRPPSGQANMHIVGKPAGTGETLEARLAATEPEVWEVGNVNDLPDDDDALYERWLAANASTVDQLLDLDDEREARRWQNQRKAQFAAWESAPMLSAFYLTDPSVAITTPTQAEYLEDERHLNREESINLWAKGVVPQDDMDLVTRAVLNVKGGARPGDRVRTEVMGAYRDGVLMALPDTFPGGQYIIRVMLPHDNRKGDMEAVYVARGAWEWEYCYTPAELPVSRRLHDIQVNATRPNGGVLL